jgi:hypothetical protein
MAQNATLRHRTSPRAHQAALADRFLEIDGRTMTTVVKKDPPKFPANSEFIREFFFSAGYWIPQDLFS